MTPQAAERVRVALIRLLWNGVADQSECTCYPRDRCALCEAADAIGLGRHWDWREAEARLHALERALVAKRGDLVVVHEHHRVTGCPRTPGRVTARRGGLVHLRWITGWRYEGGGKPVLPIAGWAGWVQLEAVTVVERADVDGCSSPFADLGDVPNVGRCPDCCNHTHVGALIAEWLADVAAQGELYPTTVLFTATIGTEEPNPS